MTPEETRQAGQLMIDAADGTLKVKFRSRKTEEVRWFDTSNPEWNWQDREYCRAPKKPAIIWDYAPKQQTCDARQFVEATPEVLRDLKAAGTEEIVQALKDAGIEYE